MSFCCGIAANGELLVADPNSEENTLHKTYRFAEMLRQAKGDYPFMICDQIDAPEEATAGETKAIIMTHRLSRWFD